jgi:hypothetical protein
MNETDLFQLERRLQRVERQNRVLLSLLGAVVAIASLGAAKLGSNVIHADELRTQRISLLDERGAVVHRWWGAKRAVNE